MEQKVAVITGGSGGLGRAILKEIAAVGFFPVIIFKSSPHAENIARECGGFALRVDVKSFSEVEKIFSDIALRCGKINALINCAGIQISRLIGKMTPEEFNDVIQVNLCGTWNCIKAAQPYLAANPDGGAIVNMGSIASQTGDVGIANYAAAKAGIVGLTHSLAKEFARHKITVNVVSPGYIESGMWFNIPAKYREKLATEIPLGRLGTAEEVARLVRFLVVENTYMTGQELSINGGLFFN